MKEIHVRNAGDGMKLKIAMVAFVVALVLVSSFAGIVVADSGDNAGLSNTIFENSVGIQENSNLGINPCGGGGGVGGGTPG